jgi:type I restriction enzyme R subunit
MCASKRKGGIIWHTQGSGKSIVMVLLAKWILENNPNARRAIVTDRDELDKQIERVFTEAGEPIKRTSSGRDLMSQLGQATPRLLCSLVHKFGRKGVDDFDAFIKELQPQPSPTVGEVFVFVDECHRTQSGKLHKVMKALMPNAVFIGFTGTPLLKKDKRRPAWRCSAATSTPTSSARPWRTAWCWTWCTRRATSSRAGLQDKIDQWFDAKTKGLNDWQKAELREQWGTMQNVLSSRSRMERVVEDIVFDFGVKPRLPASGATPSWWRRASTRRASTSSCSRRRLQGQVRGGHVVQPAGEGRDAGRDRRQHARPTSSSSTTPTRSC